MTTKIIEAITIGNELLNGAIADADLAILGRHLSESGLSLARARTVDDSPAEILEGLAQATRCADVLLITGGLGSTGDDRTRETVAEFFGLKLAEIPAVRGWLLRCWREFHPGGNPPRRYFRQAMFPEGSDALPNRVGSAPGIAFTGCVGGRNIDVFILPGPPREFEPMLRDAVLPRLGTDRSMETRGFLVCGVGELELENFVTSLALPPVIEVAYCAVPEGTKLFLRCPTAESSALRDALDQVRGAYRDAALADGGFDLAPAVLDKLRSRRLHLAVAESCTGGALGAALTAVAGASEVFSGGVIAYENRIKHELLRVPAAVLENFGAVSAECADAMVRGAAAVLGVEAAIAVTGVAGPGGGTPDKPVGLVWIGTFLNGEVRVESHHFRGDRESVRFQTRAKALLQLFRMCSGKPGNGDSPR